MKSLSVKLGVILIGLAIFCCAEVWGADWKFFASGVSGVLYYDTQNITRPSTNIVRVWTRFVYTEKGVLDAVRTMSLVKGIENVSHSINLWEINCLEKKFRTPIAYFYDNRGGVIISDSNPSSVWDFIPPGSVVEVLYETVCK